MDRVRCVSSRNVCLDKFSLATGPLVRVQVVFLIHDGNPIPQLVDVDCLVRQFGSDLPSISIDNLTRPGQVFGREGQPENSNTNVSRTGHK